MELALLGAAALVVLLWKSNTSTLPSPAVIAQARNRIPVQGATVAQKPKQANTQPSSSKSSGMGSGSGGSGVSKAQQSSAGKSQGGSWFCNFVIPNYGPGLSCGFGKCNCGTCDTPPDSGVCTIGATTTECSTDNLQNNVLFNCSRYTNVAGPSCSPQCNCSMCWDWMNGCSGSGCYGCTGSGGEGIRCYEGFNCVYEQ